MTKFDIHNQTHLTILALVFVVLAFFSFMGGCVVGTLNTEVDLRTAIVAKSTANEATLDTMWKVIKQKAQISEQAVANIKDMNSVYEELVQGRSGGALFKMVTENYPNLGQQEVYKLYGELMASVEAERKTFKRDQHSLVDLVREHNAYLKKPISGTIIALFGDNNNFERRTPSVNGENTYVFVTSDSTQAMVNSGAEDDIELFNAKPAEKSL